MSTIPTSSNSSFDREVDALNTKTELSQVPLRTLANSIIYRTGISKIESNNQTIIPQPTIEISL